MSLTSELDSSTSPIRRFIDRISDMRPISRQLNQYLKTLPINPHPTYESFYNYTLVGTAADLRFRAFFAPSIHNSSTVQRSLKFLEDGVVQLEENGQTIKSLWGEYPYPWKQGRLQYPLAKTLKEYYELFLQQNYGQTLLLDERAEYKMAKFCFLFARLDHAYRNRSFEAFLKVSSTDIEVLLENTTDPVMLEDLVRLTRYYRIHHDFLLKNHKRCLPGCVLSGSVDVQGADLDLIIDRTMWEFKVSIKAKISTKMLRQIIGYWLLDYDDEFSIDHVAIYLARQQYTARFDVLNDLILPIYQQKGAAELRRLCKEFLVSER